MQEQVIIRLIALGIFTIVYYIVIIIQKNKQTEQEELIQKIPYDFIEKCEQIESNIEYDKTQAKKLENTNKICEIAKNFIIWILGMIVLMDGVLWENILPVILAIIVIYLIIGRIQLNDKKEYQKIYKNNVLKKMIKQIQPQWIYQIEQIENAQIEEQYTQANFDNLSYNRFGINDKIELAKEDRIQAIHLDIKNSSGKYTEKIFEGIFIIKILSKNWNNLQITKKDIEKIAKMNNQEKKEYCERIALNQQNNKEMVEKILQELIHFYQKYQIIIEIKIKQNKIYARAKIRQLLQLTKNNQEGKRKIYTHIYITNQMIETIKRIDNMIQNEIK